MNTSSSFPQAFTIFATTPPSRQPTPLHTPIIELPKLKMTYDTIPLALKRICRSRLELFPDAPTLRSPLNTLPKPHQSVHASEPTTLMNIPTELRDQIWLSAISDHAYILILIPGSQTWTNSWKHDKAREDATALKSLLQVSHPVFEEVKILALIHCRWVFRGYVSSDDMATRLGRRPLALPLFGVSPGILNQMRNITISVITGLHYSTRSPWATAGRMFDPGKVVAGLGGTNVRRLEFCVFNAERRVYLARERAKEWVGVFRAYLPFNLAQNGKVVCELQERWEGSRGSWFSKMVEWQLEKEYEHDFGAKRELFVIE